MSSSLHRRRYPWAEWFARIMEGVPLVLVRGRDFGCTTTGMIVNVHAALATRHRQYHGRIRIHQDPEGDILTLTRKDYRSRPRKAVAGISRDLWENLRVCAS